MCSQKEGPKITFASLPFPLLGSLKAHPVNTLGQPITQHTTAPSSYLVTYARPPIPLFPIGLRRPSSEILSPSHYLVFKLRAFHLSIA